MTEHACLLTIIYPVFDVRGDIVERVRLWAQQDIGPLQFRIMVVASAATELDESSLRLVLRDHDAILRVPAVGREADYWNAGAGEATTPWLLFVEAHALPSRESVSALIDWIAANPDGVACNFRILNFDTHRVARLMRRWFAEVHANWADRATWPRLHRTAFAIRRDVFEEVGPLEPGYGQFAPVLLSAHMNDQGRKISTLAATSVIHEDSPEIAAHHDDTTDYVRGEADARTTNKPTFFEKYFGFSPLQSGSIGPSSPRACGVIVNALLASIRNPRSARQLLRSTRAFWPAAFGLSPRAGLLAALTHLDEHILMSARVPESLIWKRFLAAHGRVARTEQLRWFAKHPSPALTIRENDTCWPIQEIDQQTIVGTHAIEFKDNQAFRWTLPVILLRCSFSGSITVTLETGGLRGRIDPSDIRVVAVGRIIEEIAIDERDSIKFQLRHDQEQALECDIIIIARELREPSVGILPGRRLGLPLFSVSLTRGREMSPPRP